MPRTLSIIKPDAYAAHRIGAIIALLEEGGLTVRAARTLRLTDAQARAFYAVHSERPFFDSLTEFMSSGPTVVMILEGEDAIAKNRELMGATNYKEAAPGTIRADHATDIEKNVVHGSDAPETAEFEIGYFFNAFEIAG